MTEQSSGAFRLLQAMPKAELHLHLDGCLRPVTALDLAASQGIDAPRSFMGMFHALVAPPATASQSNLLRFFDLPIALLQDREALERVTTELVEDKASDNVRYIEIKWAPAVHVRGGLTIDDIISSVASAARSAAGRLGVVVTLTVVALRSDTPATNVMLAESAVKFRDVGVTGFDLAGFELEYPDVLDQRPAFDVARRGGLGLTVHAGELPHRTDLVRQAMELGPDRIAHGATAIGDPALVEELITRGITLDLCPTSNVQAGTVANFASHPLAALLRRGVGVTISCDDSTISDTSLSEELHRCHTILGLTLAEIWSCNVHALRSAFVDEATRNRLLSEFGEWSRSVSELVDA